MVLKPAHFGGYPEVALYATLSFKRGHPPSAPSYPSHKFTVRKLEKFETISPYTFYLLYKIYLPHMR
jgi:hypothetical protein